MINKKIVISIFIIGILMGCSSKNKDIDFFNKEYKFVYLYSDNDLNYNGKSQVVATNRTGTKKKNYTINVTSAYGSEPPLLMKKNKFFITLRGAVNKPNHDIFEFNSKEKKVKTHNLKLNAFHELDVDKKYIYGSTWLNGKTLFTKCSLKNKKDCQKLKLNKGDNIVGINADSKYLYLFKGNDNDEKLFLIKYDKNNLKELEKIDLTKSVNSVDALRFYKNNLYFISTKKNENQSDWLINYDIITKKIKKINLSFNYSENLILHENKILIEHKGKNSINPKGINAISLVNLDSGKIKEIKVPIEYFQSDFDDKYMYVYSYDEDKEKEELKFYDINELKYKGNIKVPGNEDINFVDAFNVIQK